MTVDSKDNVKYNRFLYKRKNIFRVFEIMKRQIVSKLGYKDIRLVMCNAEVKYISIIQNCYYFEMWINKIELLLLNKN